MHDFSLSDTDSDYQSASQRENRAPLRSIQSRTLSVSTVTECERRVRDDAVHREQRAYVEAQRLLREADDHKQRLLCDACDRKQRLLAEAQQIRQLLLADAQQVRDTEGQREQRLLRQRELKLRRDMYDLAAERARAASLEAELKYLKATVGQATVAYEVVQVPDVETDSHSTTPMPAVVVHRPDTIQAPTSQPHTLATHDNAHIQTASVS